MLSLTLMFKTRSICAMGDGGAVTDVKKNKGCGERGGCTAYLTLHDARGATPRPTRALGRSSRIW